MAPLINRNAIKATYYSANSKQIQAIYNYERTILNAYIEVIALDGLALRQTQEWQVFQRKKSE